MRRAVFLNPTLMSRNGEHLPKLGRAVGAMNGGARLRRALISQRHKLGLDGVSPHPGSHGKLIQPGQICAYATQICPIDSWFMGSEHLQNSDVNRSHEPGRRLQSGTGFQPVSPEQARCLCHFLRFMESLLSLLRTHWDHEPDWHPSPCPLPARRGEGGRRPGEGRFMESLHSLLRTHWDHEPLRLTEARSGPRVCDPQPARFMGSFHGFATAHLDHERWGETPSSPDLPATGIS